MLKRTYSSINRRSLNSITTKHNKFKVNSKNIDCETEKKKQITVNTPNLVLYWNLYIELGTKFIAFLSAFIANLEHVSIDLNT